MAIPVSRWHAYQVTPGHNTVVGNVLALSDVYSPQLGYKRTLLAYLPPSYSRGQRRYPVLYMHDGQNLFDAATAYGGLEWQVDETMEALSGEGLEAIVVGLYHGGNRRLAEYNPFPFGRWEACGDQHVAFLVETVKPLIDASFRTRPGRAHTGVLGSSMGGLISLYAFFRRPDVFGLVGALSPAFWMARGAIYEYVRSAAFASGKIYLDNGVNENDARPMVALLKEKGYPERALKYVADADGAHTESAWAKRLPDALRFLLAGL